MRFWRRWADKRMAREFDRARGYDRPLAERAAEMKRLSVGAPVIVHRVCRHQMSEGARTSGAELLAWGCVKCGEWVRERAG